MIPFRSDVLSDPYDTPPPAPDEPRLPPDEPTSAPPPADGPGTAPGTKPPADPPPGLIGQLKATRDAGMRLAMAHVELAKAEASEIGGRIARAAALIGLAVALFFMIGMLLVIGLALFTSEWLFGSMGWGILHGILLLTAVAVASVLAAIGFPGGRLGRAFLGAVVIGLLVAGLLGLDGPNRSYTALGETLLPGIESGVRPLVVGTIVGAVLGVLLAIVVIVRQGSGGGRVGLAIVGALAGAAVGAFSAITFGPQAGIALGLAVGYGAWTVLMATDLAATGIDTETMKARFMPSQTIDTSKETLEWLRRRMPPGMGS